MQDLREMAISELRDHGIAGSDVYLIDLIPLVEIIWADGVVQTGELEILNNYIENHVKHVNDMAGYEIISMSQASAFIDRYLEQRPNPALMKSLRALVRSLRLSTSDEKANQELRESLLSACLDIAASSVRKYPYGLGDRFNPAEKRCFFEILESFK